MVGRSKHINMLVNLSLTSEITPCNSAGLCSILLSPLKKTSLLNIHDILFLLIDFPISKIISQLFL